MLFVRNTLSALAEDTRNEIDFLASQAALDGDSYSGPPCTPTGKKKKSELDVAEPSKSGGTLSSYDKRPAALVRKYGELYAQTRLETLESLDKLSELNNHDDLKSKLLFSVIVVRSLS